MNESTTPGMANGTCVEEPIVVWRKSVITTDPGTGRA